MSTRVDRALHRRARAMRATITTRARGLLARGLTASAALALALATARCSKGRDEGAAEAPVFDRDVAPILAARCASCHGGDAPAAGWRATSYLSTIACVAPSGAPATLPASDAAPILAALDRDPHRDVVSASERATLAAWVRDGAPAFRADVHPPGITDPRSPDFHGALLRSRRWGPMLDANDPMACGRCHDGAPARPAGVTGSAPGATACTTCHSDPGGPLACNTCHGSGARAYPPRDPCFFPADAPRAGAHAAHVERSSARAQGLACSTCHPVPTGSAAAILSGPHANGSVDVTFDPAIVTGEASFDAATHACAVSCHDRGGARPRPQWTETSETSAMGCNDCHRAPPANHFAGPCTPCHHEANANGTALTNPVLHVNGRVDLGDSSGKCGACHGRGDDPFPTTNAHPAHEAPTLTTPIACATCHVVPTTLFAPGHLDGQVTIAFTDRAIARGAKPTWDGHACAQVACHGAQLPDPPATPAWADTSGAARACGSCHPIPPSNHTTSTSCDVSVCHGAEVTRSGTGVHGISVDPGKALHVNGVIDTNLSP